MKKFFCLFFVFLSFLACKAQKDIGMTKEYANNIYLSYLSVNGDAELSDSFSKCQLEYKEKNDIAVYTCTVSVEDKKDYIFVISDSAKLKSEVNPSKKNVKELIYIANLKLDKNLNKVTGEKLLFSTKDKIIIDNQEVKQHF